MSRDYSEYRKAWAHQSFRTCGGFFCHGICRGNQNQKDTAGVNDRVHGRRPFMAAGAIEVHEGLVALIAAHPNDMLTAHCGNKSQEPMSR